MAQPKLPPCYQWWKGSSRVRVWVPLECRNRLPEPHTKKTELVRALETTNPKVATDRGAAWVAEFKEIIRDARPGPVLPWNGLTKSPIWRAHAAELRGEAPKMIDVTPAKPDAYSFETLVDECAADRSGWPPERIKVIKGTFQKLAAHIGHDGIVRKTACWIGGVGRRLRA